MRVRCDSSRITAKDELQDLKITYHELMIQYYLPSAKYFEICQSYFSIYSTKLISDDTDATKWKAALKKTVLFLALSPFDSEVSDLMQRLKSDKKTLQLLSCKRLLDQLTTDELIRWPLSDAKEWQSDTVFQGDKGPQRFEDFHKRIVQHVCCSALSEVCCVCEA